MASQENGAIKQLKIRIPMHVYVQLEEDAKTHNQKPSTRARNMLCDQLMHVVLDQNAKERLQRYIDEGWEKIRKSEAKKRS